MDMETIERKLTAILSADVKGYSRLMGQDEPATVKAIKACRIIMTNAIEKAHGRVVDSPGDNVLAEFASAVDALNCAISIQEGLEVKNADLPDERKMIFRIGINIGDVIVEGEKIYGDGVNIAARLEGLADPGGICISGALYDQVKKKVHVQYDFMGLQKVKNISDSVRAYRVVWTQGRTPRIGEKPTHKWAWTQKAYGLLPKLVLTVVLMGVLMPVANHFNLNLLTKVWQCQLTLLPNAHKVTVVTLDKDEHRKMNVGTGEASPPPFDTQPKMWRQYNPKVIKNLFDMGVEAVGFDFWYSPAYDAETKHATEKFVRALKWAQKKQFPIIVGQYQNRQEQSIYDFADWGFISVYKDLGWIDKVMYLKSWDKMPVSGHVQEKPGFFLAVLAEKLRLEPQLEMDGVKLIGHPVPRRLWLAFAETPFDRVPYHDVYNGWADKAKFSGRIVLIGMGLTQTDYFRVPYSPTDFTPHDKADGYGMPGVFLFAHAINQIIQGYYHTEIQDEWSLPGLGDLAVLYRLKTLSLLLLETLLTCLLLHGVLVFTGRKQQNWYPFLWMGLLSGLFIGFLAFVPILFGLLNFFSAALIFSLLSIKWRPR